MASPEEIAAMSEYLKERRRHRARVGAQTASAAGAVMSGRETATEALDRRDPYPEIMSEMEKVEASKDIVAAAGEVETNLYATGLKSLDTKYGINMDAFLAQQGINQRAAAVSAQLSAQGKIEAARRAERAADKMSAVTGAGAAYLSLKGKVQRQGKEEKEDGKPFGSIEDFIAGGAKPFGGGTETGFSKAQKQGKLETIALRQGKMLPTDPQGDPKAVAIVQATLVQMYTDPTLTERDMITLQNTVYEVGVAGGLDMGEVIKSVEVLDPDGYTVDSVEKFKEVNAIADAGRAKMFKEDEDMQDLVKHLGASGQTGIDTMLKVVGAIDDDIYGNYRAEDEVLPGTGVIPETDVQARYTQMLEVIESQPEIEPVKEMKQHIMGQSYYQDYLKSRGYEDADPDQAFREYTRETKALVREGKQNFRKQKRKNLEEGIAKARGPQDKPKAVPAAESAEVAGGSDRG